MSALGTRPIPGLGLEAGGVADEVTSAQQQQQRVVGNGLTKTAPVVRVAAQKDIQQQQPQPQPQQSSSMGSLDAQTHPQQQQQRAYYAEAVEAAGPRKEEQQRKGGERNEEDEGNAEAGQGDARLGSHSPDQRPWSTREDEVITRMVSVC